jgi:PhnB protein
MQVNSYLLFNGQCENAFKFYAQGLGGKIEAMIPHEGTPAADGVPAEWRDKILHARLTIGDQVLMGSDAPPARFQKPQGFSVNIQVNEPAGGKRAGHDHADPGDFLGETLWHAGRSVRDPVDGELRKSGLTFHSQIS